MKRKILSLAAMVLTTITGNAQNNAFKSLTVEAYEQAIATQQSSVLTCARQKSLPQVI